MEHGRYRVLWAEGRKAADVGTVDVGRHALRFVGPAPRPREVYLEEITAVHVGEGPTLVLERATGDGVRISSAGDDDGLRRLASELAHLQATRLEL